MPRDCAAASRCLPGPPRAVAKFWCALLTWCTKRSSPPPSGVMKPKPLVALNHLTVPVCLAASSAIAANSNAPPPLLTSDAERQRSAEKGKGKATAGRDRRAHQSQPNARRVMEVEPRRAKGRSRDPAPKPGFSKAQKTGETVGGGCCRASLPRMAPARRPLQGGWRGAAMAMSGSSTAALAALPSFERDLNRCPH